MPDRESAENEKQHNLESLRRIGGLIAYLSEYFRPRWDEKVRKQFDILTSNLTRVIEGLRENPEQPMYDPELDYDHLVEAVNIAREFAIEEGGVDPSQLTNQNLDQYYDVYYSRKAKKTKPQ